MTQTMTHEWTRKDIEDMMRDELLSYSQVTGVRLDWRVRRDGLPEKLVALVTYEEDELEIEDEL